MVLSGMVLWVQVLDILRAQSADELEEAVSEWTEVRPATAGTARLRSDGEKQSSFEISKPRDFLRKRMVWGKIDLRKIC